MHLNNGELILFKNFIFPWLPWCSSFFVLLIQLLPFWLDLVTLQYPNWIFTTAEPLAFYSSCICSSLWCWMALFFFFNNLNNYNLLLSFTQIFLFVYVHRKSLLRIYCLGISHIFIKSETKPCELFFQSLYPVTPFFPSSLASTSFRHLVLLIQVIANSF